MNLHDRDSGRVFDISVQKGSAENPIVITTPGEQDVIVTPNTFEQSESSQFNYTQNEVVCDGNMHLADPITETNTETNTENLTVTSRNSGAYYDTNTLDTSSYDTVEVSVS